MIVMIWCFLKSYLTPNLRFYGFDALIKELIWILGSFLSLFLGSSPMKLCRSGDSCPGEETEPSVPAVVERP